MRSLGSNVDVSADILMLWWVLITIGLKFKVYDIRQCDKIARMSFQEAIVFVNYLLYERLGKRGNW
jgi:hypothetical protein